MILKHLYVIGISVSLFSSCYVNKLEQKRLLARITAAEDNVKILNLLAGSAFSSDVASSAYWTKMFTEDGDKSKGEMKY
jgi:hypothetical protein